MGKRDQFCFNRGEIRVGSGYDVGKMRCPYCRAEIEIVESKLATNYVVIPYHEKPARRPKGGRAV
jgi:hypothetical protein